MLKINSMVKKSVLVSLLLCVLFLSLSCGSEKPSVTQNKEQEFEYTNSDTINDLENEDVDTLTDEDFVIKNKDTYIKLREPFDEMKIGEKVKSYQPCDENHEYDTYVYENIILMVVFSTADGNVDIIGGISLLTPTFETARGLKVGDSISKAFEKYGVIEKEDDCDFYMYFGPDTQSLIFYVDENEEITRIRLEIL